MRHAELFQGLISHGAPERRAVCLLPGADGGAVVLAADATLDPLGWLTAPALAQAVPLPGPPVRVAPIGETIGLEQAERIDPEEGATTITLSTQGPAGPFVWEIARVFTPWNHQGTLERLACYLRVEDGNGALLYITNDTADPFPSLDVAGTQVRVRWVLDLTQGDADPGLFLFQDAPAALPIGGAVPGLPRQWRDLRYAWGGRMIEGHQSTWPGPCYLRLFVELETIGPAPRVITAGALVSTFRVAGGGPTHAATRAATTRRP